VREKFDIIVACDLNRGIGKNNALPWRLTKDLKYFRDLTSATPVPEEKPGNPYPRLTGPLKGESTLF